MFSATNDRFKNRFHKPREGKTGLCTNFETDAHDAKKDLNPETEQPTKLDGNCRTWNSLAVFGGGRTGRHFGRPGCGRSAGTFRIHVWGLRHHQRDTRMVGKRTVTNSFVNFFSHNFRFATVIHMWHSPRGEKKQDLQLFVRKRSYLDVLTATVFDTRLVPESFITKSMSVQPQLKRRRDTCRNRIVAGQDWMNDLIRLLRKVNLKVLDAASVQNMSSWEFLILFCSRPVTLFQFWHTKFAQLGDFPWFEENQCSWQKKRIGSVGSTIKTGIFSGWWRFPRQKFARKSRRTSACCTVLRLGNFMSRLSRRQVRDLLFSRRLWQM